MYNEKIVHKDRFGYPIEPGDVIIRSSHGSLNEVKVARLTPKGIVSDGGLRLDISRYQEYSRWDNTLRKWIPPANKNLIGIINKTKALRDDQSN